MGEKKQQFRPVPILLEAYEALAERYKEYLDIDVISPRVSVIPKVSLSGKVGDTAPHLAAEFSLRHDHPDVIEAARETLVMLQDSYTKGRLTSERIHSTVNMFLPDELSGHGDDLTATLALPTDMTDVMNRKINRAIEVLNEQTPNLCRLDSGIIHIRAQQPYQIGAASEVFDKIIDDPSFAIGRIYNFISKIYGNSHIGRSARLHLRNERRVQQADEASHVVTHEVHDLYMMEKTNLVFLAHRQLALQDDNQTLFFSFNDLHGHVAAEIDEDNRAFLRLYIPVLKENNGEPDNKLRNRMFEIIHATAQEYNTNFDRGINAQFVRSLNNDAMTRQHIIMKASDVMLRAEQIQQLSTQEVADILEGWLPASKSRIIKGLGIDDTCKEDVTALEKKLADLIEASLLYANNRQYHSLEDQTVLCVVKARDHDGNVYLTPVPREDQNEDFTHVEIMLPEDQIYGKHISVYSLVTVKVSRDNDTLQAQLLSVNNDNDPELVVGVDEFDDPEDLAYDLMLLEKLEAQKQDAKRAKRAARRALRKQKQQDRKAQNGQSKKPPTKVRPSHCVWSLGDDADDSTHVLPDRIGVFEETEDGPVVVVSEGFQKHSFPLNQDQAAGLEPGNEITVRLSADFKAVGQVVTKSSQAVQVERDLRNKRTEAEKPQRKKDARPRYSHATPSYA